jgi:arylsulfatase A-like enzyme
LSAEDAPDIIRCVNRAGAGLAVFLILLGVYGCGERAPLRDLPPTFVWDKDQPGIDSSSGRTNIWGGFEVRADAFVAVRDTACFILWRKEAEGSRLSVEYTLRGKPCRLRINGILTGVLAPSDERTIARFGVQFNAGFNFLEFDKSAADALIVRGVLAGSWEARRRRQLETGESLTVGTERASGRLVFRGRGVLRITEVPFREGRGTARTFDRKPGLLSGGIVHSFDDPSPGFVTFTAKSGSFDIVENSLTRVSASPLSEKAPRFARLPDIFIFLFDACRPDHLGAYGYDRPTSPNLDRFAADAVVFENAYANATFTRSSVATLFTGLYPDRHRVRILTNKLSEELLTIPVYLKGKGYRTSLFTATGNVSKNTGFARGIDDYFSAIGEWHGGEERIVPLRFDSWLDRKSPLFSYVHIMEPHLPIIPPPPFRDMFSEPKKRDLSQRVLQEFQKKIDAKRSFDPAEVRAVIDNYDAAIAYADNELGKLLKSLKDRGIYEESLIIVLSDHGESLYERKYWGHGEKAYEETARVPLVVKFPASLGIKGRAEAVVELAGAFPTLLDLFGQDLGLDGKSWLPAIAASGYGEAMAVARSFPEFDDFGLRWRDWYAVMNPASGTLSLFRSAKPVFTEVGGGDDHDVRLLFKVKFLEWLNRFAASSDSPVSLDLQTLPKNELENLRSLGYIK